VYGKYQLLLRTLHGWKAIEESLCGYGRPDDADGLSSFAASPDSYRDGDLWRLESALLRWECL
jgi:hypothetical protein